jgi:hypothetical protein
VAVPGDTATGRAGVPRSPTCLLEPRAPGRCRCGLGAARASVGCVAGARGRVERRLGCDGRAATAGAAPAGAVPRPASLGGADSVGAGWTAAGAACGADITGVGAAGGGAGRRGGSSVRGSTYPRGSSARRVPSWTCETAGGSPGAAIVPTVSPSATPSPTETITEPSCVRVTAQPSAVRIETARPFDGSDPAKLTCPAAGARTSAPATPAMSIPRCPEAVYAPPP